MILLLLALGIAPTASLCERHRAWLEEEVHFLISTRERQEFLALSSEEARDRFIDSFWRRRDPTPGTARNEAREGHLERLAEADRLFTLVASRRGRFTDRGRVYQLLGPPSSREDFTRAGDRLYPLELWHYTGVRQTFLPETFYLIFFREGGFGDFRLWSPSTDGPQALIRRADPGRFLLQGDLAYQELRRVDLELAAAVERLVPGEAGDLSAFASESLLTNLAKYPDIAEQYVRVEEQVSTRSSFQTLSVSPVAVAIYDATGIPEIHYALEVPSQDVRWSAESDRFRTSFQLICRILTPEGGELDRIEDLLDLDVTAGEREGLQGVPLSFQARLVLPSGRYRLEWALTNVTSGATGSSRLEVRVPEEDRFRASDLILARSRHRIEGGEFLDRHPFQLGHLLLAPSPDRVFPPGEAFAFLQLPRSAVEGVLRFRLKRGEETIWQRESRVEDSKEASLVIEQKVPLEDLPDGAYRLEVTAPGATRETGLTVDHSARVPAVRILAREGPPAGDGRIRFQRGRLLARLGRTGEAIREMDEAAALLPQDLEVHLKLAYLLSATGEYEKVIELLSPLEPRYAENPDLLVFLGFASLKTGRYPEAIAYYERALALKPGDQKLQTALAEARQMTTRRVKP